MYKWSYKMPKEQGRENLILVCIADTKKQAHHSFVVTCRAMFWPDSIIQESKIELQVRF
jgi:hypothetical protein